MTVTPPAPGSLPRSIRVLLDRLDPSWRYRVTAARGPLERTVLSEEVDGGGHRRRLASIETVDSLCLRACHPATRRAVVALWVRRPGRSWAFDSAWRGRHPGEDTPQRLSARELAAYTRDERQITQPTLIEELPA